MAFDHVLRAITDDGSFRVIAASTTETVTEAIRVQRATGTTCRQFADLLTATVLVRDAMAPDLRLQSILQGDDGRSRIVADTQPNGGARGLVQMAKGKSEMTLTSGGVLQVQRTLHNGAVHQGVVSVPESGSISSAFMKYMQESEQIVTMIAVGCHLVGETVRASGGYLVQILPEVSQGPLMVMTERLRDFEDIVPLLAAGTASPESLLNETLFGMPYTRVGEGPVRFQCPCSPERVASSLASLPRSDIEEMIADGRMLDLTCDYCNREYAFSPQQLRGLLQSN